MKFTPEYIIPIVILVMVSIFSLFSFNKMFVINENYSNKGGRLEYSEYVSDYSDDQTMMPDYSDDQTMMPDADYETTPYDADYETMMPDADYETTPQEGFATFDDESDDYDEDTMIDTYSQARGGSTCEPGPYSNSSGYLCLDNNQKHLLMTRGMNQSGSDSQIGQD